MNTFHREATRRLVSSFRPADNCFAETEFHSDFEKRAESVKEKIRAKYRRLIETRHWTDPELNKLGHGLRKYIRTWEEEKKRTERRMAWDVKAYLALIDRDGELTKASERMARIVAEQKEKDRSRPLKSQTARRIVSGRVLPKPPQQPIILAQAATKPAPITAAVIAVREVTRSAQGFLGLLLGPDCSPPPTPRSRDRSTGLAMRLLKQAEKQRQLPLWINSHDPNHRRHGRSQAGRHRTACGASRPGERGDQNRAWAPAER
jgi:hypothetical protein